MLKILRLVSFITVIGAICMVIALMVFAFKGNPEIQAFLESPGIIERSKNVKDSKNLKEDVVSPLVAQARTFALRIDPPPPPKPKVVGKPKAPAKTARTKPAPKLPLPTPKVPVSTKYDLLATVLYESDPEKSLALFKTSGNKQEWFRQGEKVGNLELSKIKDGSVIFTQNGQKPQEQFVPVKTQVKSLLKDDNANRAVSSAGIGSGGVSIQLPGKDGQNIENAVTGITDAQQSVKTATQSRVRSGNRTPTRPDISQRIQRIRSIPRQPSPQEQKESLDNTLAGISELMGREDDTLTEEQRQKEKELWTSLMQSLKKEQEFLDEQIEAQESDNGSDEAEEADEVDEGNDDYNDDEAADEENEEVEGDEDSEEFQNEPNEVNNVR